MALCRRFSGLLFLIVCFAWPAQGLQAPVATQVRPAPPSAASNTVNKLPRVDIRHPDFATRCANAADPTGHEDSACAIQAAVDFAASQGYGGELPSLYFPAGSYRVSEAIRVPCTLQILTDGPTASSLVVPPDSHTGGMVVYAAHTAGGDPWLCAGGIDGLMIQGSGHTSTGSLLEIISSTGYRLNNVKLFNSGGRGLNLQGPSERLESHNLEIDAVRWPLIMGGVPNEDHFFKTNINSPGMSDDGYCFNVNCVKGRFPGPNEGPGRSPTPIRPDPHAAVWVGGAEASFYGGSIKSLEMIGAFHIAAAEADTIASFYFEDFPHADRPVLNPAVVFGGTLPMTKTTEPLNGSCTTNCSVAVESTDWFPTYLDDPRDLDTYLSKGCQVTWIMPADFEWGNKAASATVPGVARGQYELVCSYGMSADGRMRIAQRNVLTGFLKSTAPANVSWPAGSIVHELQPVLSYGGGLTLLTNHFGALQPGGPGYKDDCNDSDVRTCGNIILGIIPDGYFFNPLGSATVGLPGQMAAQMTMINNSMFTGGGGSLLGTGYVKAHMWSSLTVMGTSGMLAYSGESAEVADGLETVDPRVLPHVLAVRYPTGAFAQVTVARPDIGSTMRNTNEYFEQSLSVLDPNLGANPESRFANGHQFLNSSCWYDVGTVQSPHAANRFCMKGGVHFAPANSGWEYDIWNGKQWVNAFSVAGSGQGLANLNVSGNTKTGSLQLGASKGPVSALSGNGTMLATVNGPLVNGHVLVADANGNIRDGGTAPGRAALDTEEGVASGFGGGRSNRPSEDGQTAPAAGGVVCSFAREGYTAAIPATDFCVAPRTGTYEITLNEHTSHVGLGGRVSRASVSVAPAPGGGTQSCSIETALNLASWTPQQFTGPCVWVVTAGQSFTFDTSAENLSGDAAYGLVITVKLVQ